MILLRIQSEEEEEEERTDQDFMTLYNCIYKEIFLQPNFQREVNRWNSLPAEVVNAKSVNSFKNAYDRSCH